MKIKFDYLNKNILLGLALLIIIALLLFYSLSLSVKIPFFRYALTILAAIVVGLLFKRTNNFISGFVGEKDIEVELKNLGEDFICINSGLDTGKGNIV